MKIGVVGGDVSMNAELYGAIEAGGTKFVCAVGRGPEDILRRESLPTESPAVTLATVGEFFVSATRDHGPLAAIGIGSFGPVDVHKTSPTFGFITETPKPNWSNTDLVTPLRKRFNVPIGFDTDVNAAVLGEATWGAGQRDDVVVYVTVGTGIGGGVIHGGRLLHGLVHTEMGHQRIPHDWQRDPYPGNCPFHGDCLEGLASGAAMSDRWGMAPEDLRADHPGWELEADYLSYAMTNLALLLSPQKIIVGGGVIKQPGLYQRVRELTAEKLADYVQHPLLDGDLSDFIVPPGLGDDAGILGAMVLAMRARDEGQASAD